MANVEIVRHDALKSMKLAVERPKPRKGDKAIAEKVYSPLSVATKLRRIKELIEQHDSTLIFVNTRQMAETLGSRFRILGVNAEVHHSSLSKESREEVEEGFKKGRIKALICTSSLELGIDIGSVELVIQYNSPRQVSRLIQRIGRSGHNVKGTSKGVILADGSDDILESLVIARRASAGDLEEISIFDKPYDVLIHQIAGIVLDLGVVDKRKCLQILKKSRVFSDMTADEYENVLLVARELRLFWEDGNGTLKKGRKTRKYYYDNLSTIPHEKKYFVKNTVTRKNVGVLDEAFVAGLEEGDLIIFKGMAWHVVTSEEDELYIEPVSVVSGEIPRWVGEEIPVEYEVARETGSLRRRGLESYTADEYTKRRALAPVKRHLRMGLPLPDDRTVVVEMFQDFAVINSSLGLKVNQTLGTFFSTLLSARSGHSVKQKIDPYRIIIQGKDVSEEMLLEMFNSEPSFIRPLLSASLGRTSLFKWKFVHTARRFGAITPDIDFKSLGLNRIMKAWENTPIYAETLKDIFTSNLDIQNSEKFLIDVASGRINMVFIRLSGPSPISEIGMETFSEAILPERAERMILRALKNRIQSRRLTFFCAYCSKWSDTYTVKNIPDDLRCGVCEARMLAPLTYDADEAMKSYRKHKKSMPLNKAEAQRVKRITELGGLYLSYGKILAEVIAARGVGPEQAKRILRDSRTEDEIYRNILKSERNYARTRRFWD